MTCFGELGWLTPHPNSPIGLNPRYGRIDITRSLAINNTTFARTDVDLNQNVIRAAELGALTETSIVRCESLAQEGCGSRVKRNYARCQAIRARLTRLSW
jgi:hypothetical protein